MEGGLSYIIITCQFGDRIALLSHSFTQPSHLFLEMLSLLLKNRLPRCKMFPDLYCLLLVCFLNDLKGSAKAGTSLKQLDEGAPKRIDYFSLSMLASFSKSEQFSERVIDAVSVNIKTVV